MPVHKLTIHYVVCVRRRTLVRLVEEASFVEFPCVNHPVSHNASPRNTRSSLSRAQACRGGIVCRVPMREPAGVSSGKPANVGERVSGSVDYTAPIMLRFGERNQTVGRRSLSNNFDHQPQAHSHAIISPEYV